jgi:hypothetical protein
MIGAALFRFRFEVGEHLVARRERLLERLRAGLGRTQGRLLLRRRTLAADLRNRSSLHDALRVEHTLDRGAVEIGLGLFLDRHLDLDRRGRARTPPLHGCANLP